MTLGSAIPPRADIPAGLDRVAREWMAEQDNAARQFNALLDGMRQILATMQETIRLMANQTNVVNVPELPVNVTVQEREQEAPIVTVEPPVVNVTVQEDERGERLTVHRDANGLITHIDKTPL